MKIENFFKDEKIEFYSAVDFSACRVINEGLLKRLGFTPRSVIVFLIPYYVNDGKNISSYATSYDYHLYAKELSFRLAGALENEDVNFRLFCDHSPIDERDAAAKAGLGKIGRNRLLLNEKHGSYVFIGEIFFDRDIEWHGKRGNNKIEHCEFCGKCIDACPTGSLDGKPECLSSITQKKGEISNEEANLIVKFNTVWGCDACQKACPYNARAQKTPIEFFHKNRIERITEEKLLSLSDEEFAKRAFAWRGRQTLERNLKLFE